MFEAKIENKKGNILTLSQNESDFQIIRITGLNPPNAQINTNNLAGIDGAKYNSSKLQTRQIVITLKLNGWGTRVEDNRQMLYRYFPTKEWCKFYFKTDNRDVYIEGYAETLEVDLFQQSQTMQIAILCPQPYFKAMDMIIDDISKVLKNFEFPFSINNDEPIPFSIIELNKITNVYNNSESETGIIIEIEVLNNVNKIEIRNIDTGESFILNYDFLPDDKIIIDTNRGQKSITLIREGITFNLFTAIQKGSKFFQLSLGDNFFSYLVDEGSSDASVHIVFKYYTLYRGV